MSETTSTTFIRPAAPAHAGPEVAFRILNEATAAGIPIPHMTIVWVSHAGPEVSMTTMTSDEFEAWATWLGTTSRPSPDGSLTLADGTRDGVMFYLGTRTRAVA